MAVKKVFRVFDSIPAPEMEAFIVVAYAWTLLGWLFIFAAQAATGLLAVGCWALSTVWALTVIWLLKS